jgi:hypothetical protein
MTPVGIERRHVVDATVVVVVLVFLGLAAAFLIDSVRTQNNYDALAAHHVKVMARSQVCLEYNCRVSYVYRGMHFSDDLPMGESTAFLVDPRDRSVRMSEFAFDGGTGATTVDDVFAALFLFAALAVATTHGARVRRRRRGVDEPSRWRVTLAPEDDPDVAPFSGPEPPEPRSLVPGQYLRLLPGDPLDVVKEMPSHRPGHVQLLMGNGELVLDTPHERQTYALPTSGASGDRVSGLVYVSARHRASGHVDDPDQFLVVLGGQGETVGRLDVSDTWELSVDGLRRMCRYSGLQFSLERYGSDRELLAKRPQWITAGAELALEHPGAEDVRELGLALWLGTGIAFGLLGATGMELVFATPVRYVAVTIALGGAVVAVVIAAWGRMTWHHRQYRLRRRPQ